MTHILPNHTDLNLAPSSLQSALNMDPNHQPQNHQQQTAQTSAQSGSSAPRKRKKNDAGNDDASSPSEPRRLRRSHEACARCRSKKIKASPAGRHRRQLPPHKSALLTLPNYYYYFSSAIQNFQDVLLVHRLEHHATRKTEQDKH